MLLTLSISACKTDKNQSAGFKNGTIYWIKGKMHSGLIKFKNVNKRLPLLLCKIAPYSPSTPLGMDTDTNERINP